MAKLGSFHPSSKKKSRSWAWLFWMIVLLTSVFGLHFRFGLTPPIARFLSPFEGALQITLQDFQKPGVYTIQGKSGPIQIELDENLIPHISAETEADVFQGQGFITAKHRLWQMDFQNLAASGRLSEVIGPKTFEMDKFQRRFGVSESARKSGKEMMRNPTTRNALEAYTEGINQAIEDWPSRQLPIEFKILDYKPELWKPENTGLLLKRMAFTLSGNSDDKAMNAIMEAFGKSVVNQLFPNTLYDDEPIIPKGTPWNFQALPIPPVPLSLGWTDTTDASIPDKGPKLRDDDQIEIGSNNWAVSGKKTKSGFPMLANDPHLSMKLPATWYIAELKAPGYHCMGATLPGAPGIISGFNEKFSWGVTNGYPDVTDWFRVVFKDNSRKYYWADGQWKPTRIVVEKYAIRGKGTVLDTMYWTELGPLVYRKGEKPFQENVPIGYALRWAAHDPGNELFAFLRLNHTSEVAQVPSALSTYMCPAQNFVVADQKGNIGMFAQHGKVPIRWKEQGKFLMLAADKDHYWSGFIPREQLPKIINPESGFVSSANQIPTDTTYPYYLGWDYYAVERGKRINQFLGSDSAFSMASMLQLQNDCKNLWAEKTLPKMLELAKKEADRPRWATELLSKWNLNNEPQEIGATLFESWFEHWMNLVWSDNFKNGLRYPDKHVTWQILLEKDNSDWFDFVKTKEIETGSQLISKALRLSIDSLQRRFGPFASNEEAYKWGNYKGTKIGHLGMIPGLGTETLFTGGGRGIVNATGPTNGQSWKMIVELGPKPKAIGIYPGGQSGNPSSPFYDNFVEPWRTGQQKLLQFKL
jgi:penicillin amidase